MSHMVHPGPEAPRGSGTHSVSAPGRDASLPLRTALGPRWVLLPFPLSAWSLRLAGKNSPWSHPTQGRTGARTQTVTFWARAGDHYRVITDVQPQLLGETPILLAHGKSLAADMPPGRPTLGFSFHVRSRGIGGRELISSLSGQMEDVPLLELLH